MISKVVFVALIVAVAISTAQNNSSTSVAPSTGVAQPNSTVPVVNPSASTTVSPAATGNSSSSTPAYSTTTQSAHGIGIFFTLVPIAFSMLI